MFRTLLSMWRSKDLLSESFDIFKRMLSDVEWMFDVATDILLCKKEATDVEEEMSRKEKATDEAEMSIRRKMVEHLSIKGEDVPAALVLFAVVKDAERIADMCVDIVSTSKKLKGGCATGPHSEQLSKMEKVLEEMFSKTRKAFVESDDKLAKEAMALRDDAKKHCERLMKSVLDSSITVKEAVSYCLVGAYFRRVAAHLYHIAAGVVSPALLFEHRR